MNVGTYRRERPMRSWRLTRQDDGFMLLTFFTDNDEPMFSAKMVNEDFYKLADAINAGLLPVDPPAEVTEGSSASD